MNNLEQDLQSILKEIEDIIAKIGNYNVSKSKLSEEGRKELKALFRKKLQLAKSIKHNRSLQLVS